MLDFFLQRHPVFSTIIQGAAGSALFWAALKLVEYLAVLARHLIGDTTAVIGKEKKLREYIYRRYTSRNGFIDPVLGLQFSISEALTRLLKGFMFVCIALLFTGFVPIVGGVCLVGALMFFGSALTWLIPNSDWNSDDMIPHWQRVAQLEQELFGKLDEQTQEILARAVDAESKKDAKSL